MNKNIECMITSFLLCILIEQNAFQTSFVGVVFAGPSRTVAVIAKSQSEPFQAAQDNQTPCEPNAWGHPKKTVTQRG